MKKRHEYIDIAKGLLMMLVIIGHLLVSTYRTEWLVFKIIYSFHMPAFFMISGILIDTEKYKQQRWTTFLIRKAKSILVPYLLFELIGIIFHQFIVLEENMGLWKSFLRMFSIDCNVGANWYLPTYFFAILLYKLYLEYKRKYLGIVLFIFSLLFVMAFGGKGASHFYVVVGRCIIGFAMIILGNELKEFLLLEAKVWKMAIAGVIIIIVSFINDRVDFYYAQISNPVFFLVGSIAGIYFILQLSKLIKSKLLKYIGKNTIIILGTHQNIIELVTWFIGQRMTFVFFVSEFLLVILTDVMLVKIINNVKMWIIKDKKELL